MILALTGGAFVGALVGYLLVSDKGKVVREKIGDAAGDLLHDVEEIVKSAAKEAAAEEIHSQHIRERI